MYTASLKKSFSSFKNTVAQPWARVLIYAALTVVMPEYFAPAFGIFAFIASIENRIKTKKYFGGEMTEPLVIAIVLMAAGMLYSANKLSTLSSVGLWIGGLLTFVSVVSVLENRSRIEKLILWVSVAVAVNGIISGIQYLLGPVLGFDICLNFWRPFDDWFLGFFGKNLYYFSQTDRTSSTFCNPNVFAQTMAMLLPFGLYYACSHRKDAAHNVMRVLVPLAFFGTLFSFSRGVYLAIIIMLLMYGLYHIKKMRFILIGVVIVILLIPSSVYTRFFSINGVQEFVTNIITDFNTQVHANYENSLLDSMIKFFQKAVSSTGVVEESSRLRFDTWITTLYLIIKKPILGYGAGYVNVRDILAGAGITIYHTHNFVLQTLVEGGIVLISTVVWGGIKLLKRGFLIIRRTSNPKLGLSIECFILAFGVMGLTDVPTLTPKSIGAFAVAIAICDAAYNLYYKRKPLAPREGFLLLSAFKAMKAKKGKTAENKAEKKAQKR